MSLEVLSQTIRDYQELLVKSNDKVAALRSSVTRLELALQQSAAELLAGRAALTDAEQRLAASAAEVEGLAKALAAIVEYVDPGRERGWHVYPTSLRDAAVLALVNSGRNVKSYEECAAAVGTADALPQERRGDPRDTAGGEARTTKESGNGDRASTDAEVGEGGGRG